MERTDSIRLNNPTLELLAEIINGADPDCPNARAIRRVILTASRGLVVAKCKRHARQHSIDELLSVGLAAIGDALPRYDSRRSAYCAWASFTADVAIRQYVTESGSIVRIPKSSRRHLKQQGRALEAEARVEDLDVVACTASADPSALDQMIAFEDEQRLHTALADLTETERRIVTMSFGLGDTEVLKPRAIARTLNLRVVDVIAIRDGALGKLRGVLEAG